MRRTTGVEDIYTAFGGHQYLLPIDDFIFLYKWCFLGHVIGDQGGHLVLGVISVDILFVTGVGDATGTELQLFFAMLILRCFH